jgi:hypothetical protein
MTHQLQTVLEAARALPPLEQLELIQELTQFLQENYPFALNAVTFWSPRSLEELAQDQATPVVSDVRTLAVDFWPADESADDIIDFVAARRRADPLRMA